MLEDFLLNDFGSGDLHKGPELDRGPSPRSLAIVVRNVSCMRAPLCWVQTRYIKESWTEQGPCMVAGLWYAYMLCS